MTKTYAQLRQQIEALQQEANRLRRDEVAGVVAQIREAIKAYGLTPADLGIASPRKRRSKSKGRSGASRVQGAKVEVKYRDDQGRTWGGRGPRPRWLREALDAGSNLSDFAV